MPNYWLPVSGQKLTYTRPLGPCESRFGWVSTCGGISDSKSCVHLPHTISTNVCTLFLYKALTHFTICTTRDLLFSEKNVYNAWRAVKRLNPLLSARMVERSDSSGFDFIVSEERINNVSSNEVLFMAAQSDDEVAMIAERSINSEPLLSNDLLGQLWIISVHPNELHDSSQVTWHVMFYMRHSVVDGVTVHAQAAAFFDVLASGKTRGKYAVQETLGTYLNLHPCIEDLNPSRYSLAKLRWRRAVASVIEGRRSGTIVVSRMF